MDPQEGQGTSMFCSLKRSILWIGPVIVTALGCEPPPRPPLGDLSEPTSAAQEADPANRATPAPPTDDDGRSAGDTDSRATPATGPRQRTSQTSPAPAGSNRDRSSVTTGPWESWDLYLIGGRRIGYSHVRCEPQPDGQVRITMEDEMTIRRGAEALTTRVEQTSHESASGELESFSAKLTSNGATTTYRGRVAGDRLTIDIESEDAGTGENERATSQRELPWEPHVRGLIGIQQALRENPLKPGETRTLEALLPVQFQRAKVDLKATATQSIEMLDGSRERLTEVRCRSELPGGGTLETFLWIDEAGRTRKAYTPAMNLSAFRTDRATATAAVDPQEDLLETLSIRLAKSLPPGTRPSRLVARLRVEPADAAEFRERLHRLPGQEVIDEASDAGTITLRVTSGIDRRTLLGDPQEADGQPNRLIESEAKRIQSIAGTASLGGDTSPAAKARRLAGFVREFIEQADYSTGFATALETVKSRRGDCTEHAVLLAALLRASGIPSRVVAGWVYVEREGEPRLMYHLWNVAYVDGGWLPLDAMQGGVAPADRIAWLTTALAEGNEYECLSPILQATKTLRVELEVRPDSD